MKRTEVTAHSLLRSAAAAGRHAYCPYSRFRVGAAVLADDGRVFTGCNVENASYGLTVCAERNALSAAIAAGARRIRAAAIVAGKGEPVPPCGACRQVLAEFATPDAVVYSARPGDLRNHTRWSVHDLLPAAFALKTPHRGKSK